MTNIDFFKQQSKNFLKDYQTKFYNESEGFYEYKPRFFIDIDEILDNFHISQKEQLGLMNAQHIISRLAGFNKWTDLIKASEPILEIGKLLIINRLSYQNKQGFFTNLVESIIVADWKDYEKENLQDFDDQSKLEVFKKVFIEEEKTNKSIPKISFDFTNEQNSQDMLMKIMKEKGLSSDKAILSSINQKICLRIIETGYASIALPLWGHDNPYREKEKLDNPIIKVKFSKDKERLVGIIMENEDVSFKTAVLYFMLYTLEALGYHI